MLLLFAPGRRSRSHLNAEYDAGVGIAVITVVPVVLVVLDVVLVIIVIVIVVVVVASDAVCSLKQS